MKDKILSIASDLNQGFMNTDEAKEHLLRLFSVIDSVCDCVIPKPKDPYHELDSKICRDCDENRISKFSLNHSSSYPTTHHKTV